MMKNNNFKKHEVFKFLSKCRIDNMQNSGFLCVASAFLPLEDNEDMVMEYFCVLWQPKEDRYIIVPDSKVNSFDKTDYIDVSNKLYLVRAD